MWGRCFCTSSTASLMPHGRLLSIGKRANECHTVGRCADAARCRLMGALTNNGRRLANYAGEPILCLSSSPLSLTNSPGYYKGIQSAGAAVAYRVDAQGIPYMAQFASCWALCAGGLVIALPLLIFKIRDTTPIEEDLKFSDETYEEVAAQHERPGLSNGYDRHHDYDGKVS